MRFYLIRHAQTAWNVEGRAQGHSDIPLDDMGKEQSDLLCNRLHQLSIDLVLTSDLQRARSTVEDWCSRAGKKLEVRTELRERNLGQFEGRPFAEFRDYFANASNDADPFQLETRPPNGESIVDVWTRLQPLVRDLMDSDQRVAVVTHGGTCGIVLAQFLRLEPIGARAFRFSNTGLTELERHANGLWQLRRYNCTEHLENPSLFGSLDGSFA